MSKATERCTRLARQGLWNDGYNYWYSRAETIYNSSQNKNKATYTLWKELEQQYRHDENPLPDYTMIYSDLLGFALACVDWEELANDFIETVEENQ